MSDFKISYFPTLNNIIYNKDILDKLIYILDNPNHNHMIISGEKNSGKNTLVDLAFNSIYPEHYSSCKTNVKNDIYYKYSNFHYHFYFNINNKFNDLSPIINDIINSKKTLIDNIPFNLLILDNFHNINRNFQISLKNIFERFPAVKIIIITNKLNQIIDPIISRCNIFNIPILHKSLISFTNIVKDNDPILSETLSSEMINKLCTDSNINNILEDLEVFKLTGELVDTPYITIHTKILLIICKHKLNQKDLGEIKILSHHILIITNDIITYIKSLLQYILNISSINKTINNIDSKFNLQLNDIKIYKLIQLFTNTDILLLKSYRNIIAIESLIINCHRIILYE